jgi:hypothetical protein
MADRPPSAKATPSRPTAATRMMIQGTASPRPDRESGGVKPGAGAAPAGVPCDGAVAGSWGPGHGDQDRPGARARTVTMTMGIRPGPARPPPSFRAAGVEGQDYRGSAWDDPQRPLGRHSKDQRLRARVRGQCSPDLGRSPSGAPGSTAGAPLVLVYRGTGAWYVPDCQPDCQPDRQPDRQPDCQPDCQPDRQRHRACRAAIIVLRPRTIPEPARHRCPRRSTRPSPTRSRRGGPPASSRAAPAGPPTPGSGCPGVRRPGGRRGR